MESESTVTALMFARSGRAAAACGFGPRGNRHARPARRGLVAGLVALVVAVAASAQIKWSAYNPATGALLDGTTFEEAATFDPATNSYTFAIPANTAVTLVATNIVPVDLPKPASGSVTQTISFQMKTSAGGLTAINRYANFGLFNYPAGSAPSATANNATTHAGLWMTAYNNGSTTYQTKPSGSPNAAGYNFASGPDYKIASSNISQSATGFGLGTARATGVGVIADDTFYNVTFRVRGNSAGTTQLGSAATDVGAGTVWADTATGGTMFKQAAYSSTTNNGFTCPVSLNEIAFYFDARSSAFTLTLANLQGYTSSGTAFNMGPAYFSAQPASAFTASVGGTLAISATPVAASVSGGPTTSYQWQVSTDGGNTFTDINSAANTSAATPTLSLTGIQSSDAGAYRLKATTSATGAVSGATTLVSYSAVSTVSVTTDALPPSVITPPADATVVAGSLHTFTVVAGGSSPLGYQWSRSLDAGATFTDIAGATSASYTLSSVALADDGRYRVTITNTQGTVTSPAAVLAVQQGPSITTQPQGGSIVPGGSITLSVVASGTPAPTYQWKKNGVNLSGATSASYAITNATGADTGSYTVVVANAVGSVTSSAAAVAVVSSTLAPTAFTPSVSGAARNPDTRLAITFNEAPTIGVAGSIRIHDATTHAVVDSIDLAAASAARDALRAQSTLSTLLLPVQKKPIGGIPTDFNYYPLTVAGQTLTIYPRNGVLSYGKSYYVRIDAGAVLNAAGEAFAGINDATTWTFTTKTSGPATGSTSLVVAADGTGDFDTVQAALDFIPANNSTPTTIRVKPGTYFEMVGFQSKHYVTLLGTDVDNTVITYPNNNTFNNVSGVYHRATLVAQSVHDFTLANLTITNSTPQNGSQAEAIVLNGSGALSARNLVVGCKFFSYQDTVQFNKQTYVSDCTIWGDVDFLWGDGPVFFENCDIRILRTGGYFTQIRNGSGNHGYVFRNCRFTAPAGITGTYFGRIDPTGFPYSEVVVLDSTIGDAANNAILAGATGASGSNYQAGWWLLNNVTSAAATTNLRYWSINNVDGTGAALSDPNADAFTNMPADETTLANYRSAFWVLNSTMAGTVTGSWTPALAPVIAAQPASQTVNAGEALTLTVTAVAIPAATYQWRKNGEPIPNATAASYTFPQVSGGDTGAYTVVITNSAGSTTSAEATVTVLGEQVAPTVTTPPASQLIAEGGSATLSVSALGTAPLNYQWYRNDEIISGATASTLPITNASSANAGVYHVVITNSAGSITSASATITVKGVASIVPTGFAASVTGGASGSTVTVTTAAELKSYAEAVNTPYTIIVSGTIDLGVAGRIRLQSNKTLRGATTASTILGTVNISNVTNVIVSNLNISADTGAPSENDGVTIANSTNVLVTKCSIYNSTDGNLDVINGSDLVTVSWCKFYYTRDNGHNFSNLVGSSDTDTGSGDGRTNYRVTWHHNWWTGQAKQRMIACRFGRSHLFNNLWDCAGNDYATESRNMAEIFSERNYYEGVEDPLGKRTALVTDVGLLMTIENAFVNCTGTQSVSTDTVFVPSYGYHFSSTGDVAARVREGAGNVTTDTPVYFRGMIEAPVGSIYAGTAVTLAAAPVDFTPTAYQWRRNNHPVEGATSATLAYAAVQTTHAGTYTVVMTRADGTAVVSSPVTLSVNPAPTGIDGWRLSYFGTIANTGSAADAADPDFDGMTNLVEYAFGLDPMESNSISGANVGTTATDWTYEYTRPADRSDLDYAVETSADLSTWTTNGVVHERIGTGPTETWQARVPLAGNPTAFFRLKIDRR